VGVGGDHRRAPSRSRRRPPCGALALEAQQRADVGGHGHAGEVGVDARDALLEDLARALGWASSTPKPRRRSSSAPSTSASSTPLNGTS
jgi:hypothetical protein